jgi:hypothetical protein
MKLACPYFAPTHPADNIAWLHPARLPLGCGWQGTCGAPGHEGSTPLEEEIKEFCNMGYATACSRLPRERAWDAVRFSVSRDTGSRILLCLVCELAHHPVENGLLEFDCVAERWVAGHQNVRVQKLAECYLQSYLRRRSQPATAGAAAS